MRTRYFSDQTASRNPPAFHPASIVPPCRFCLEQLPDQPTPRVSLDNITIQYLKSNFNYLPRSNRDKISNAIIIRLKLFLNSSQKHTISCNARSSSSTRVVISQFAISLFVPFGIARIFSRSGQSPCCPTLLGGVHRRQRPT